MEYIYHLASPARFQAQKVNGEYIPEQFSEEGFIHCSYPKQLLGVLSRYYQNTEELLLLVIDRNKVPCDVIDENTHGGTNLFPHIYGALPLAAVLRTYPLTRNEKGIFDLPELL
ncbi:MAG: DUF952 domain-containing protein [Symploca sp. SIO2E6]|nr:DUF952 domain-containing protein [Symploca sp. SIO2E6]